MTKSYETWLAENVDASYIEPTGCVKMEIEIEDPSTHELVPFEVEFDVVKGQVVEAILVREYTDNGWIPLHPFKRYEPTDNQIDQAVEKCYREQEDFVGDYD